MMTSEQSEMNETVPESSTESNSVCVSSPKSYTVKLIPTMELANTKQCISCNREMPVSSSSCDCGHVLSDIKSLEGKRYSGYREELYSRLEIRRILEDNDKPKRPRLKQKSPPKEDISSALHKQHMTKRKRNRRKSSQMAHNGKHPYEMSNASSQKRLEDNPELWYLNPRFNFADALADINKRLTSQTSFWIGL